MATVEQKLTRALQCRRAPLLIPVLQEVAEAQRPGATVVSQLRRAQERDIRHFTDRWAFELRMLGILVAAAATTQGGLIVEATARETDRIAAIIKASKLDQFEKERILPLLKDQYQRVLQLTADTLRGANLPTAPRQSIEASLLAMGGKRMGLIDLSQGVKDSLFTLVDAGRELGLNPRTTAGWIEYMVPRGRFVNAGSKYRAELIARTETLNAQRMSTIELFRESPVVNKLIAFDGESDEECAARNGEEFTFDEAEAESESTHPNCVLAFGPVA